jgi:tetratricopeptide (TPR) repeat protein
MNKVLVTLVLALTTAGAVQGNAQDQKSQQSGVTAKGAKVQVTTEPANQNQQQTQQPTQPAQPGQQAASSKVIKDPAEYNAYITALNTQDPTQRGAAMEAFANQYPQSVVLTDSLEQAMAAYQQANNPAKVEQVAKRLLQLSPNNVRALAIVTALTRAQATQGKADALKESCADAQAGLQALPGWTKPEGVSDADFAKLRNQMANIFNGAAGFCALQSKDYANARTYYLKALEIDPSNLQDVYQLSVAQLEMNPIDVNGFWYCSKAMSLAQSQNNAQAAQGMAAYCKSKYHRYHGGDDGWDQVVAAGATGNAPAQDFAATIKPAPTPCELAVTAVQQNDPGQLSFSDWEFILSKANCSPANKDAADKVWKAIQDKQKGGEARLKITVKVIGATKESVDAAITEENQQVNKADLHVILEKPALKPPATGASTDVIGVITNYTPDPFMFTMDKAELPTAKAPVRQPARRPTSHRKTS